MPSSAIRSVFGLLATGMALCQAPRVEFEVASVRPNTLDDHIVNIAVGPGPRFTARGYTVVLLVQRAYGVMDWNVAGGPNWIRVDRFDITAKANIAGNITEAQLQSALQKLLFDRFKLRIHRTAREMPGHALVVARSGAKLTPSADREEHEDTFRMSQSGLSGQAISMPNFARFVGGKLGYIAADETGLTGLYDFDVHWPIDSSIPEDDRKEATRFAVNSALNEQAGLRFIPKKIIVPTIVIDSVQKASASEN